MKRVLVTGANGFIGREVCKALVAWGWHVVGAVRRPSALGVLPPQVEPMLAPDFDFRRLHDVVAVVHLVARTHVTTDRGMFDLDSYRRVNVAGTQRLLEACEQTKVSRFVYLSSIKAVGEGSEKPYTEQTPCHPEDAYGLSKWEAEQLVLKAGRTMKLETTVLRPPLVYGPHVQGNFLRLLKLVRSGAPLPLASIRNSRSMIFIKNLTSAVEVLLQHPLAAGEVFHVADHEPLATGELLLRLKELQGRGPRLLPFPVALLRLAGMVVGRGAEVERLVGSLTVATQKIQCRLGWSPPYDTDEGLRETVDWFQATYLLDRNRRPRAGRHQRATRPLPRFRNEGPKSHETCM